MGLEYAISEGRINLTQLQLLSHRRKTRERLRNKGVLIARSGSGERKGYKLPSSLAGAWLIIIRKIKSYFINLIDASILGLAMNDGKTAFNLGK